MTHKPFFIDLRAKRILILGGGEIAIRKLGAFSGSGALITLIAPKINAELPELAEKIERHATVDDITKAFFMVIIATNDKAFNEAAAKKCEDEEILYNRCDDGLSGNVVIPKLKQCGIINAAIYSEGVPAVSKYIHENLDSVITPELATLAGLLKELRTELKSNSSCTCKNKEIIAGLLNKENLERIKRGELDSLKQEIMSCH